MDTIKDIVAQVMGKMASGQGASIQDIQEAWGRISKDSASRATALKDGCLTVSADSSLRLVKLNLNREALLKDMQKDFPTITRIHFKVEAR